MPRDYKVYLEDILQAIDKIQKFTKDMPSHVFLNDEKTHDAVIRNLEVIGEAIKKVPDGIRVKHPQIDWKKIGALRDILIHEYFGIDVEIVWDIVQNKLPVLKSQIQQLLQ